jgi:hypothetical protein
MSSRSIGYAETVVFMSNRLRSAHPDTGRNAFPRPFACFV